MTGEIGPSVYNQIVKENVTGNVKTIIPNVVLSVFVREEIVACVQVQFMFLNSRFKVTFIFSLFYAVVHIVRCCL